MTHHPHARSVPVVGRPAPHGADGRGARDGGPR